LATHNPIQTPVQAVFFRYRKILSQQNIHGAVIEPVPMHPKLAARLDQPVHYQQFQHLWPRYAFPPLRPRWSPQNRPIVVTSKPANRGHPKTGQSWSLQNRPMGTSQDKS
jgi:hypothetical protein